MLRGEREFLVGVVLLLVAGVVGAQAGSMIFPGTVALSIMGILCIAAAAFDTGS
jgi:hypothetical protein